MPNINIDDAYILNETGAQVDKVTGLFTKDEDTTSGEKAFAQLNIGTAGSNRNLLDNPWFTVNQRGFASNAGTNNVRCVDRWLINSGGGTGGATTLNADGTMTLTAGANYQSFQQTIEIVPSVTVGKTMTISVLLQDGTIEYKSFVVPAQTSSAQEIGRLSSGKYRVLVYLSATGTNTIISQIYVYAGNTITIRAVKLELGSVSTLANDAPPDYWQELDKCLYYFERITNSTSGPLTIGAGFADGAHYLYAPVRMHRKRAATATVSTSGAIYAGQQSSNIAVSSVTQYNSSPDGIITLLANAPSSFTNNGYYRLALGAGAHIDFSADL